MKKCLQYGCGFSAPMEWINYDASPTLKFEKIPVLGKLYTRNIQRFPPNVKFGNILSGLPEIQNSFDCIYCSHILEHLSYSDFKIAVRNTYLLLKPDGIFRCIVPDLKIAAFNYLESYDELPDPAHQFLKSTMLGSETRPNNLIGMLKNTFGNSKHLWMWDEKTLAMELKEAGFKNIRNCHFNDSEDPHFSLVEEEGRFYNAVAIECRK